MQSPANPDSLPFQAINHLTEGDTVLYSPVLREHEKRPGEISLVMVPAKRAPKEAALLVTDPKAADKPQRWSIPKTLTLAALVYGPEGLSRKKVEGFRSQDDLLIAQLAELPKKTAQTEALVQALSKFRQFVCQRQCRVDMVCVADGMSKCNWNRTAAPPMQYRPQTLFAAMNPQLATYNPLASSSAERVGQTASVAAAAATLFFGSPIGLAAGGRHAASIFATIAFPGTQFRSSFAQPLNRPSAKDGLNLCGQNTPAPPHTRVAFIWAVRIPNTPAPTIKIGDADFIPPARRLRSSRCARSAMEVSAALASLEPRERERAEASRLCS